MATVSPSPLDPWINRVLGGRYCLVAVIGRGGMGVVYRAWDRLENRYAVVKMPRAELLSQSQFRERFARELDVVRSLWHAAIVPVVDIGEEPLEGTASGFGMPYAVMPYLAGGSLSRRQPTRDGKPVVDSPQSLWRWLPQIAEALDYVHREQLVHRDVKPDNILFDGLGDPHLGDFGIAKVVLQADAETRGLTKTGMSIGTPEYMAPELIGSATPDGRADQYALAVTVFEILAGRKPFLATSPAAVLVQQATVPAPRLDSMRRDLPQSAVDALERALAKKPEARFSSCEGFAHALLAEIEQPGEAKKLRLMCPDCGELLKVQPSWAGQTGKCPHCTKKLAVSADLRSLWLEADRSEAGVPRPVKRQSAIRRAASWINGHGVAVAVVLGVLALIPALMIAFGLTEGPSATAVTQNDLTVETLRDQLAVATASEQTVRKAFEESQAEVARLRADLEQAATELADEMQAGQEREAVLRRDLAALQQPAEPRTEMAADAKATTDAAPAATEPGQVAPSSAPPAAIAPFDAVQARKHQEEWAKHLDIEVAITNSIGQTFVVIPPGKFVRGDPANRNATLQEVTLTKPFLLGQTEVTNAQWNAVMGSMLRGVDHPVGQVRWDDAVEFCRKLSALPEEQQAGRVYRLPTEAEWEFACRAGTDTVYSFGDELPWDDYMWGLQNTQGYTQPVGMKKPNAWGLFDMYGNVFEWCNDWYDEYPKGVVTDPQGPSSECDRLDIRMRNFAATGTRHAVARYDAAAKVLRGGSCKMFSSHVGSGRVYAFPGHPPLDGVLGFRLALSLSALESKQAAATAVSAAPSSPPETGAPQVPPLPEGTPEQLLEFVEGLQRPATRPRSREELLEYMRDVGRVSVEAAERILAGKPQGEIAVRAAKLKLESLMMLGRLGDEQSTAAMKAFATTLVNGSSPELAREAEQMLLNLDAAISPFDTAQARKYQETWANHLGIEVEITNSIGQKFVVIPPGTFTMGEGNNTVEVTLTKPFLLGQTEVTNAQWKAVMDRVPTTKWRSPDRPVANVTWEEAIEFCRKLSALPEEQQAGRVYRLPTEAEWEFACRAGTTTRFSFREDESRDDYEWYANNSGTRKIDAAALAGSLLQPAQSTGSRSRESVDDAYRSRLAANGCQTRGVGQKKPNAWGLFDMHGNVREWCNDWYGGYLECAATDPQGPVVPDAFCGRVCRGDCFTDYLPIGSSYRGNKGTYRGNEGTPVFATLSLVVPTNRREEKAGAADNLGFRLALSPSGAQLGPPEAGR